MSVLSGCAKKADLELGKEAMKRGDYRAAVEFFSQALKKDSLNPYVHYNLCFAYASLDSIEPSLGHYVRIAELGSNLKDDKALKELVAVLISIEPYPSSVIPMPGMNQFKGAFSPKGDMIAVAASKSDRADIYLVNLDGSNAQKVVSGGMNTDPVFSPDGGSIAFVSDRDGDEDLYLYDLTTREVRQLTRNTAQDFAPSFSPDGRDLVFVSNMDEMLKWEIYTINIESGRIARLTNNEYWDGFPKFAAGGQSIVFSSKRGKTEDIYVMRRDGGGVELLYSSPADDNDPTLVQENLFFKSEKDGEWEIYRYNIERQHLLRLTNNEWPDWNPRVSHDGTKILVARKSGKRWVLHFLNLAEPVSTDFIVSEIKRRRQE
ncbi:PD40 domain-containing protein [candidate division WOR-3 bacterium]|nr:PD40 domain-containing protein [candidate division WOR-3 bacterium]